MKNKAVKQLVFALVLLCVSYTQADEWYTINAINSASSEAMVGEDINNYNDIVGYAFVEQADGSSLRQLAVSIDGQVSLIDSSINSENISFHSLKINDSAQVVGNYRNSFATSSSPNASFIYLDGELQDLGSLAPSGNLPKNSKQYTNVYDLNNKGEVVGISSRADGTAASFLWANGEMMDFNSLHPSFINRFYAFPESINDNSQILIRNNRSKYAIYDNGRLILMLQSHLDYQLVVYKLLI